MRRDAIRVALAAALVMMPAAAGAQQAPRAETYQLDNGLRVVLAPDPTNAVVAVNIAYRVGSRDEVQGLTGFAHLFEHMMFKGSANLGDGEHMALVTKAGGSLNAQTMEDRTIYWQVLPSNQLALGLWLEAERMRSLDVTAEKFDNQRAAVKEEVRLKVENPPYALAFNEALEKIAHPARCYGYAHAAWGSMADLDAASVDDALRFFERYYVPNNATLVVTGDFDVAQAQALITQYFGDVARGTDTQAPRCEWAVAEGGVRRRVQDTKATLPVVQYLYRIPGVPHADYPALDLLGRILGEGETSQLNRSLVREQKAAAAAVGMINPPWPRADITALMVAGFPNPGVSIDSIDALLVVEVAQAAGGRITQAELEKAKNRFRASMITQRQGALARSNELQEADYYFGDANAAQQRLERYMSVTLDDLKRVAATYLRPENAVVTIVTQEAVQ
jgi:zinc protease